MCSYDRAYEQPYIASVQHSQPIQGNVTPPLRLQFSVTSGTIFASRKLAIRDYLAATAIFVNAVKGISALQLGRDLDVQYKTAFVLAHKLREAIAKEQSEAQPSGVVEVDGAYFGGHVKQENAKADRRDRRLASERTGKRQSVVVARERQGKTLPFVVAKEADAVALIRQAVAVGSIVHADEASGWDRLHAHYDVMRINHSVAFSKDGACTKPQRLQRWRIRSAGSGRGTGHRLMPSLSDQNLCAQCRKPSAMMRQGWATRLS